MERKVRLENPMENQESKVEISWLGFVPEIYTWVLNHTEESCWLSSGQGSHLSIKKESIRELIPVFEAKNYEIDARLLELGISDDNFPDEVDAKQQALIPYDYQVTLARRMVQMRRCINASEMGTGKTCEAILAAKITDELTLVICPASLIYVWRFTINRMYPDDIVSVYGKDPLICSNWIVASYDQVRLNPPDVEALGINCVIADEAHYLKSVLRGKPNSQRAKVVMSILEKTEYVFLLTGTPIPSHVIDLYNLLVIIKAEKIIHHNDFYYFANRYCGPTRKYVGYGKYVIDYSGSSNLDELYHLLTTHYMLRKKREEVLPGLQKIRQTIPVNIANTASTTINADNFISQVMSVRNAVSLAKSKKTIEFIETILEQEEKVVVACCFLRTLKKIEDKLAHYKCVHIVGAMSSEERTKAIDSFQNGDARVCLLSLTAGGVGVTLSKARVMVFTDYDWVPSNLLQCEARILRIGQSAECCLIYYMVAVNNDLDQITAKVVERKLETINAVVDANKVQEEIFSFIKGKSLKKGGDKHDD